MARKHLVSAPSQFKERIKVLGFLVCTWVLIQAGVMVCHTLKPLPEGISFVGDEHPVTDIHFLKDLTFMDAQGRRQSEQEVFDAVFEMIDRARSLVLIDMFLFNPFLGASDAPLRPLSSELTDRLVAKKTASPEVEVVLITDPINHLYHGMESGHMGRLEAAGVRVVNTAVDRLRDSNPLYSSFWRLAWRWFGNQPGDWAPNPFGVGRVSVRSYLHLLNFKANHRKTIVIDDDDGLMALVTTGNPHDGSSAHENVALQFRGQAAADVLEAEQAVLALSNAAPLAYRMPPVDPNLFLGGDELTAQVVSERKIKEGLIQALEIAGKADKIRMVMFYLADRDMVDAILRAHRRGADIEIMLDPNRDAFGREKNGIPNRPVANELHCANVKVRWRETHGEQCHTKLLYIEYGDDAVFLSVGSANYTRRNLDNFNLELNLFVRGVREHELFDEVRSYLGSMWENRADRMFTVDYETYEDTSSIRQGLYRVLERTGLGTF